MRRRFKSPQSAPLVISLLALVVASSGTAIAAAHLVSGDNLIAKRSLSGNRLRAHTLSGAQINLAKLGKVPSAGKADFASGAAHAGTAGSALNATNAANANLVSGNKLTNLMLKIPTGNSPGVVYTANGLALLASCAGGVPALTVDGPTTAQMNMNGVSNGGSPFGAGANGFTSPVDITGGATDGSGTLTYTNASLQTVTMNYSFNGAPTFGSSNFLGCLITANLTASS